LIAAALKAIPNGADVGFDVWNKVGMATWRASGGSAAAFAAFDQWSEKYPKHSAAKVAAKWAGYFTSPPTSIGFGTLDFMAREANPSWRDDYDAAVLARINAAAHDPVVHAAIMAELGVGDSVRIEQGIDHAEQAKDESPKTEPRQGDQKQSKANETVANLILRGFSSSGSGNSGEKQAVLVRASDVVPRAKEWLWPGHLLRGGLELLTGLPGLGKSQVQCHFVACASAGLKWPDGASPIAPASVIMVTAEDALDQEVVPRLIAAGANLERVHILKSIKIDNERRQFLLAEDLDELQRAIKQIGDVVLITIDPITAYMGGKMDSHKTTEVRSQLGPLKDFAERSDVAISAITHPSKNAGHRAIDHFIGSQAFIAAARIGHACFEEVGEDEKPTGRVLFTNPKNNPSPRKPTLAYRIVEIVIGQEIGTNIAAPHVA
jgi:hypothetical protein